MLDFNPAFEQMIVSEGGYTLHEVPGDRGGQTYAGISRKFHPDWEGWKLIDEENLSSDTLKRLVKEFYKETYWVKIGANKMRHQIVAQIIFDFSVNAGKRTAIKLAQRIVGTTPDGLVGPKTINKINGINPGLFIRDYTIAKVERYAYICNKDQTQCKFLLGWLNRTLRIK